MQKDDLLIITLLFLFTFVLISATSYHYGLAWDEPYNFLPAEDTLSWLSILFSKNWKLAFSAEIIDRFFVAIHEHPPLTRWITALFYWFITKLKITTKLFALRTGEFVIFSLLISLIYLFMRELNFSKLISLFSSLSFLFMPRIFGQAHFATTDIPMAFMWLLTVYCFYLGLEKWNWSLLTGVIFGLALATKINAFFIPIPLLIYAQIYKRNKYHNNLFFLFFISPIIFLLSWPWLWYKTKERVFEYLYFYTQHKFTPVYYFGKLYYLVPAPVHYPIFYTIATIPLLTLILIFTGIVVTLIKAKEKTQSVGMLILFNALTPILIQSFPNTPKYDGIRLFIPSFPFLACLAGIGLNYITDYLKTKLVKKYTLTASFVLFLIPSIISVIWTHPYQLSYYNLLVGGITGAKELGLETTYWCEAINYKVLNYINQFIPTNARIRFLSTSYEVIEWYQQHGLLRKDISILDNSAILPDYYILLCRQGFFGSLEWFLYKKMPPIKTFSYRDKIPLVAIYKVR